MALHLNLYLKTEPQKVKQYLGRLQKVTLIEIKRGPKLWSCVSQLLFLELKFNQKITSLLDVNSISVQIKAFTDVIDSSIRY